MLLFGIDGLFKNPLLPLPFLTTVGLDSAVDPVHMKNVTIVKGEEEAKQELQEVVEFLKKKKIHKNLMCLEANFQKQFFQSDHQEQERHSLPELWLKKLMLLFIMPLMRCLGAGEQLNKKILEKQKPMLSVLYLLMNWILLVGSKLNLQCIHIQGRL